MNRYKENKTCSVCFVNVFKLQENKFKIIQNNFQEIKIIKKDFLEKPPVTISLHDKCMGGKRPKIGGN